eukprot:CAMPEP_0119413378 /NCGR_PEP_ID=MMETSP1335-20130426/5487_1 /TAXON_ID=259385 /ORGANISM="Chrysoculter rhomboideus, Strain RCC1486" /LENGTH=178 /DNA_ID=CAMNT_0007438165 /DNA_START=30 /DNA_END=566 /DNA_ORIENTATION=-
MTAGDSLSDSLADVQLSSLDNDYLSTIMATRHVADDDISQAHLQEVGYQPLADDENEDWDNDHDDGRIVAAVDNSDNDEGVGAPAADAHVSDDDDFGDFEAAMPSESASTTRDIEITDDKRKIITSIMSGITLKGAPAWAANFVPGRPQTRALPHPGPGVLASTTTEQGSTGDHVTPQ